MMDIDMELRVIGRIESSLETKDDCPKQGYEADVTGRIVLDEHYASALEGLEPEQKIVLVTWMHEASRDILSGHPRGDETRPRRGVFALRSPMRPNPIGIDVVDIVAIESPATLIVRHIDQLDGTPVLDIKPHIAADGVA
jgi:tRNA-Thr(GGU) m(6)t(6)A37 methyltransferase TsaA